jgi:hypothetical protein
LVTGPVGTRRLAQRCALRRICRGELTSIIKCYSLFLFSSFQSKEKPSAGDAGRGEHSGPHTGGISRLSAETCCAISWPELSRPRGYTPSNGRGPKRLTEASVCTAGRGVMDLTTLVSGHLRLQVQGVRGREHVRARQAEEQVQGVRGHRHPVCCSSSEVIKRGFEQARVAKSRPSRQHGAAGRQHGARNRHWWSFTMPKATCNMQQLEHAACNWNMQHRTGGMICMQYAACQCNTLQACNVHCIERATGSIRRALSPGPSKLLMWRFGRGTT